MINIFVILIMCLMAMMTGYVLGSLFGLVGVILSFPVGIFFGMLGVLINDSRDSY